MSDFSTSAHCTRVTAVPFLCNVQWFCDNVLRFKPKLPVCSTKFNGRSSLGILLLSQRNFFLGDNVYFAGGCRSGQTLSFLGVVALFVALLWVAAVPLLLLCPVPLLVASVPLLLLLLLAVPLVIAVSVKKRWKTLNFGI